jgi:cell wall assembly regulator SMI1
MTPDLTDVFDRLRQLDQPVPRPLRLPTASEVESVEEELGLSFHPDFRRYLLEVSDVVFGTIEPVTITNSAAHTYLATVAKDGRDYSNLPVDYAPICESNSDLYCVTPDGKVVFWPHDGTSDESWPSVAAWIEDVWIGESGY